jgi:hypothetical protein
VPGKIFISYRRDDVAGDARGVRDALAAKFGASDVFMDVDDLRAGQRFDVELAKALDACDVFVAITLTLVSRDDTLRRRWGSSRDQELQRRPRQSDL